MLTRNVRQGGERGLLDVLPGVDLLDAPIDGFFQFDEVRICIILVDMVQRFLKSE